MGRKAQHYCHLATGQRIPFSLSLRNGDPFFFVRFRAQDRRFLERSTGAEAHNKAIDAAIKIIKEEYAKRNSANFLSWDDAEDRLATSMQANNNKSRTIEDYLEAISALRKTYPEAEGPGDITVSLAKEFSTRYGKEKSAFTVASRLRKHKVIWEKWFIRRLGLVETNPWKEVESPKLPKLTPNYLKSEQIARFFAWLEKRWDGWRLPILFFTVKGLVGCRILELCSLRSGQFREGRLVFPADETKGRKERKARLPEKVLQELNQIAGKTFLWERYADDLRAIHRRRKHLNSAKLVKPFAPARFKRFLQNEICGFLEENPDEPHFKAHDFRRKAMTEAYLTGVGLDRVSVAFGCHPETMRKHYLALDETEIADDVLRKIQGE
jgi:integrase